MLYKSKDGDKVSANLNLWRGASDGAFAFLESYRHGTRLFEPVNGLVRLHDDRVKLHCQRAGDDVIYIASLLALQPGRGHGSHTIRWLCDLADTHRVELNLCAVPLWSSKIERTRELRERNEQRLIAWYSRYGFEKTSGQLHANDLTRKLVENFYVAM